MISPINKRIEVITTTCIINPITGKPEKSKVLLIINAERIIIATFIKLFAISIVASKRFGVPNNLIIILVDLSFCNLIFSICEGFKEKNAISDPDIKAEHNNKTSVNIKEITTLKVNVLNKMPAKIHNIHK